MHLLELSLRKCAFQLSQGAYAPFAFVLDNFILLLQVKAFVDVNPLIFYLLYPFDNFIIDDRIW